MKLRRILAGFLAGTVAMGSMVVSSITASANVAFGSSSGEWEQGNFVNQSSPEMAGIDLSKVTTVTFNATALDLNWGWNNGKFYVDGGEWQDVAFGGTESGATVVLEAVGDFEVADVPFSVKTGEEAGNWALGYGTSTGMDAFELVSIEFKESGVLLGTWADNKWIPAGEEVEIVKPEAVPFGSSSGEWEQGDFINQSSPEMADADLSKVTAVTFNAKALDLNWGWNNGKFYVNGGEWQDVAFGGTESGATVVLEKIGEFKVENVPFSIKTGEEAGNWALGYGTSTAVGAFELISIEFFADTTLVGTWTKDKWTPEVVAPTKYAIEVVSDSTMGEATTDVAEAEAGATVTVTATPKEGFELSSITVNGEAITGTTFTMPEKDVEVVVTFKAEDPEPDVEIDEEQVNAFVERLYTIMLNRESDAEGKQNNVNGLLAGETAADIAETFVLGPELKAWNISNEEFVNRMYLTFLNRTADEEGKAIWLAVLEKGCSYGRMFQDFCNSTEFKLVCDSYGIEQGSYTVTEARDINENVTHYCSRMYTKALGRAYDVVGLNTWTAALVAGEMTPEDVAVTFLNCDEFNMWNHSDEIFVEILYRTLFNREADAEGKQTWLDLLGLGTTRKDAIETFVQSEEYAILKASLGL